MKYKGYVHKFKDNVNTDEIIPARYLDTTSPLELAKHCMEGIDVEFSFKVKKGDIIVAGENFGCGSSREHAAVAIKALGISCVIARSYAWIFYRNAINIGLPIFESAEAVDEANPGDLLEVDSEAGRIMNITNGRVYTIVPYPEFMMEIINAGGLMEYIKKKWQICTK